MNTTDGNIAAMHAPRKRATTYVTEMPIPAVTGRMMHIAMRIAEAFPNRLPETTELERMFGMSTATAYRWRSAVYYSRAGS